MESVILSTLLEHKEGNLGTYVVNLGVEPIFLGYQLSFMEDYTKKVPALRFTLTTEDTLPPLKALYMCDSTALIPSQTPREVSRIERERIIAAHYGVYECYECYERIEGLPKCM